MENNTHKEIKVYGTLVNHTVNTGTGMTDANHSDFLTSAYQLYDNRFAPKKGSGTQGAVIPTDKYQDIINKRLTAISYDPTGDNNNGITYIEGKVNLSLNLGDLNDVNTSGEAAGNYLKFNGTNWIPASITISDIVGDLGTPSNGDIIKYVNNQWILTSEADTLAELTDVTLSNNLSNKILYHGATGNWVDGSLSDILPTATDGQVLKYDGTQSKWIAGTDNTGGNGVSLNQPLSAINSANLGAPSSSNNILMWNGSAWVYTTIDSIAFTDTDIDSTPRTLKQWITYLMNNAGLWLVDANDNTKIVTKNSKAAVAAGFYDSTQSAS